MLSTGDKSNTREKQQKREGEWESMVWKDEGLNCSLSKQLWRGCGQEA